MFLHCNFSDWLCSHRLRRSNRKSNGPSRKRSHCTTQTWPRLTLCPKLVLVHLHIQIVALSERALFTSSERIADVSLHCLSIWISGANVLSEALRLHFSLPLLSRFISYSKNSFFIQKRAVVSTDERISWSDHSNFIHFYWHFWLVLFFIFCQKY